MKRSLLVTLDERLPVWFLGAVIALCWMYGFHHEMKVERA